MKFVELTDLCKGKKFEVFNSAEIVVGIRARDCANFSRKQLDKLVDFVKLPGWRKWTYLL